MNYEYVANKIKELESPVLVITDTDPDGKSSALLMKAILDRLNKQYKIYPRPFGKKEKQYGYIMNLIQKEKPNSIIMLDYPIDDSTLNKIGESFSKPIIYIDHHKRSVPQLKDNIVYFDIRALKLEITSTSGAVYRIGKALFNDFGLYSNIAAIGAIGDFMFDPIIKEDLEKYYPSLYQKGSITPIFIYLFDLISYSPFEDLMNFPFPKNVKAMGKTFFYRYKNLADAVKYYESDCVLVYKVKSSTSFVSTYLSGLYPDKIIVVFTKVVTGLLDRLPFVNRYYRASIRNQSRNLDVGKIVMQYKNKIQGGGHPRAAAIMLESKYLDHFISYLESKCNQ
ncbi:NEQ118 [Nanoarchaeum equitans Kin4-M]|uniref:NEQ118 n=1 Tax=Nanoarchaeum equitans (strain Kin4-M) TaxID=228908 RepID=Q74MK4_NANEQ|nr:NEQ118 [Nanoarchaeum equitans Kin4-M]